MCADRRRQSACHTVDVLTPARAATVDDLPSWMQLAAEVEPLFGPMPDFEARVRRAIERRTALVIATGNTVAGAALLSRPNQPHHIHWLAVLSSQRRRGVGHALIAAIVDRWPTETIEVVTFTADTAGGAPPADSTKVMDSPVSGRVTLLPTVIRGTFMYCGATARSGSLRPVASSSKVNKVYR